MVNEFNPLKYIDGYLEMENGISETMNDEQHEDKIKDFLQEWGGVIPSRLYHYMPFSQKYHVESLVLSRLWFSYPMYYNDPNDSRILVNISCENINKKPDKKLFLDYLEKALTIVKERIEKVSHDIREIYEIKEYDNRVAFKKYFLENCNIKYYEVKRILEKSILEMKSVNGSDGWEKHYTRYKKAAIEAFLSGFDKEIGICSFSSKMDNLLMWTHYANQSKGICIGYEKEELIDKLGIIFPVCYKRPVYFEELLNMNRPVVNPSECRERYLKRFLFKTREWEYENEWRVLLNTIEYSLNFSASSTGFLSPALHPSVIYIGNSAEQSDVDFIKAYCEFRKIDCYKMRIEDSSWQFGAPELICSFAS